MMNTEIKILKAVVKGWEKKAERLQERATEAMVLEAKLKIAEETVTCLRKQVEQLEQKLNQRVMQEREGEGKEGGGEGEGEGVEEEEELEVLEVDGNVESRLEDVMKDLDDVGLGEEPVVEQEEEDLVEVNPEPKLGESMGLLVKTIKTLVAAAPKT
ncbi:unnamed protein product [Closterium sp. NIES-64]|nr:unnamed protein product [Closterium sp. NIES-64]